MDKYTNATYGSAGLTAFFASLSLFEWGFIIGMGFSMVLGILTYLLNRREQVKRTRMLQAIIDRTDPRKGSDLQTIGALLTNAPKDI